MDGFYRALLSGASRAEALGRASATVRAHHPDPFFWAPFILLGETGPVTFAAPGRPVQATGEDEESRFQRALAWRRTQHTLTAMGSADWAEGSTRDSALDAHVQRSQLPNQTAPLVLTLLGRTSAVALVVDAYPGAGHYTIASGHAGISKVTDPLATAVATLRPERMDSHGEGTLDVANDSVEGGFVGKFDLHFQDGRHIAGSFRLTSELVDVPEPLQRLLKKASSR
jgi:hypothetical protein